MRHALLLLVLAVGCSGPSRSELLNKCINEKIVRGGIMTTLPEARDVCLSIYPEAKP